MEEGLLRPIARLGRSLDDKRQTGEQSVANSRYTCQLCRQIQPVFHPLHPASLWTNLTPPKFRQRGDWPLFRTSCLLLSKW